MSKWRSVLFGLAFLVPLLVTNSDAIAQQDAADGPRCWNCVYSDLVAQWVCEPTLPPGNPGYVSCIDGTTGFYCTVGDYCTPTITHAVMLTPDGLFVPHGLSSAPPGTARAPTTARDETGGTIRACNGMIVHRTISTHDGARIRRSTNAFTI